MFRDKGSRERVAILERWRAASPPTPPSPVVHAVASTPLLQPPTRRELPDEAALFAAFEAELQTAVAAPLARVLSGWLEQPRERFREQPTAENRAAVLAALDRVEDVLTAALLTPR